MLDKDHYIFDIETDGLLDRLTKIHCLSYFKIGDSTCHTLTDLTDIGKFFTKDAVYIGHNIIKFDFLAIQKVIKDFRIPTHYIDTIGLSFYLNHDIKMHGLETYSEVYGIEKPVIDDYDNMDIQKYIHRCEQDVMINTALFLDQKTKLQFLYNNDYIKIIKYLNFKLNCLKDQAINGIPLDTYTLDKHFFNLEYELQTKQNLLSSKMPNDRCPIVHKKPKVMYNINEELTVLGKKWITLLESLNLPLDSDSIKEKPNPNSIQQIKYWLLDLGWKPVTFLISKATGQRVPQVTSSIGGGLCRSVKELISKEPIIEELESYNIIKHRLGILKSFKKNSNNNKLYAKAHGFTNTLRLKHSEPVVNLPKPGMYYGKEIRECLFTNNDDLIMCGSDVSSLEDSTKQHYIYNYDPKYVTEMRVPGFDPHLDIGVLAGLITKADADFFKSYNPDKATELDILRYKGIKKARHLAKTTNFCATYGGGGAKIAETAGIPVEDGFKLHSIYWKRNSAIKQVVRDLNIIQDTNDKLWLLNPVSNFWIPLKNEKDAFSTLNQNTGVYVFDSWINRCRSQLLALKSPILLQYHDEIMFITHKSNKNQVEEILLKAMEDTNRAINLNVKITISIDWGNNYAQVH